MEKKPCPVDRGKLLIALECCRRPVCPECPYRYSGRDRQATDALSYINYLEELLNAKADGSD